MKVWSLSLIQSTYLSFEEVKNTHHVSNNNKITKVYLEKTIKFEEILFLIDLFPHMKYLQIGCPNNIDIQLFVRVILMKIISIFNSKLLLLAFWVGVRIMKR